MKKDTGKCCRLILFRLYAANFASSIDERSAASTYAVLAAFHLCRASRQGSKVYPKMHYVGFLHQKPVLVSTSGIMLAPLDQGLVQGRLDLAGLSNTHP